MAAKTTRYVAAYHDRAAIVALVTTQDPDEIEESSFDIAERNESTREFQTEESAVAFLVEFIKAEKDFFGQCEVRVIEKQTARCDACICQGWQVSERIIVDDTGIADRYAEESECD